MISSLQEVLAYRNDEVIYRFCDDFDLSVSDSEDIFIETLRWLWLCGHQFEMVKNGKAAPVFIPLLSEVHSIDLMWHTFLLFTKDYSDFCEKYFGFYIHHSPQTRAEKSAWQEQVKSDPFTAKQKRRESLRVVYEFIHDQLGADVLERWCEEYPERFKSIANR